MSGESESPTALANPGSPRLDAARFTPGTIVSDRYRIVALLGSGGMGEVYRADDMKLGQRVALKFVPADLTAHASSFQQLCAEVRIGRQISHPNVCRIYDIADLDGQYFISMQYIDGEDLASLLRRVGRLPPEKALSLARDLCAGLAAAHDHGVVHRDIKPANVMIDSRGQALIADFGLAVLADEMRRDEATAGTPAYMAPEQIRGGEITQRTDIYALGLVLYEVFTGRRLFSGTSMQEISGQHASIKARPSSFVRDVTPEIERLILSCVEENPSDRPPSAHALLAALPGGDPLGAAIAAGETPSPEMVAAAGAAGDVTVTQGWLLFLGATASILLAAWVASRIHLTSIVPVKPRAVLVDRGREIASSLGVRNPGGEKTEFSADTDYLSWATAKSGNTKAWDVFALSPPSAIRFTYRSAPSPLVARNSQGRVSESDPPEIYPGMATLILDDQGRLTHFRRVPPSLTAGPSPAVDWSTAFAAASLDAKMLRPAQPASTPPYAFDQHLAWTGVYPNRPDIPIRVEAASLRGNPVYFAVIEPWDRPVSSPPGGTFGATFFAILVSVGTVGALMFARRNLIRGRGDRRGALRIAAWSGCCQLIALVVAADHAASYESEWLLISHLAAWSLFEAASIYFLYLAIEPYVRRQWPHMLIAWNRVAAGRVRDPLVGRDLLIAAIVGAAIVLITAGLLVVPPVLGFSDLGPPTTAVPLLSSPLAAVAHLFDEQLNAILWSLAWVLLLVMVRLVVRSYRIALIVMTLTLPVVGVSAASPVGYYLMGLAMSALLLLYLLNRHGVFAMAAAIFFRGVLIDTPFTFDLSSWFAPQSTLTLLILIGIAAWAFYVALAGKPMFGQAMLEEQPAT